MITIQVDLLNKRIDSRDLPDETVKKIKKRLSKEDIRELNRFHLSDEELLEILGAFDKGEKSKGGRPKKSEE